MRSYLPGHASLIEIVASKAYYVLNGCLYEEEENFIIMMLRPVGWGCRIAFYLVSLVFCFLSLTRSTNPIFQYSFSRERNAEGALENDETDAFEWFVYVTYGTWVLSILTAMLTYLVGRYGAKNPYSSQYCASFPFIFCNRTAIHNEDDDGTRCGMMLLLTIWFLGNAVAASIFVYAAMSHTFVKRNVYFAWLLVVLLALVAMGTLADALSLGGPTGIYVQSRAASWLASLRAVVIVPLQVIFTLFFVWMCNPPWRAI